jgi:hypothetical protein
MSYKKLLAIAKRKKIKIINVSSVLSEDFLVSRS